MSKPHKHAELIKAWAYGSEIEFRNPNLMLTSMPPKPDPWKAVQPDHAWNEFWEYRIKPEPPKYPQTRMTDGELLNAFAQGGAANIDCARFVANAAIACAIKDGDVVPAAMLEKVAKRVEQEYIWHTSFNIASAKDVFHGLNIQAIINRVKEGK